MLNKIFSDDSAKAIKAREYGYLNAIQYLAPASSGGAGNLCAHASAGCIALCLGWFSGQSAMVANLETGLNSVRQSRIQKTKRFMHTRAEYMRDVVRSIELLQTKAAKHGLLLCVRLNGSSDIGWEGVRLANGLNIFGTFPNVQFVDYTKNFMRACRSLTPSWPKNYHLTFSRSETNEDNCERFLALGGTVAAVFRTAKPNTYLGHPVIDGDLHDLRHTDARGHVIALSPKGAKAKKDVSGFVIN